MTDATTPAKGRRTVSEDTTSFRFLSGAAMAPRLVLATYPGATFIARAQHGDDWGIVIALPGADAPLGTDAGPRHEIITDDGRRLAAVITAPAPTADPGADLAAAKYWELPPAYVATLASR